ncbi:amidohydrolase family protein [Streptomyces sp. NBC_00564]|uniref:amidohydrolase family protein n=1 Tax=Streptomyces sp. NBC_00564 TaxID=2903663 RepID=UPI002FCDDEE5|nr:amidohydrolase family protein [Streptomyces sp. NBC_00564]
MTLILRDVELAGRRTDVAVSGDGRVSATGRLRPGPRDTLVEGRGGALLPGLADRHVHLLALAKSLESVDCGPPRIRTAEALADALRARATATAPDAWIRGVGYHESVAGALDRDRLDAMVRRPAVRVQHRSGALWTVNSAGARVLGLDEPGLPLPGGVERDAGGRATGRLWRVDSWLRRRMGPSTAPDLAAVGRLYASYGVTAVHDATPELEDDTVAELSRALTDGRLLQRVTLLGAGRPPRPGEERWERGPYKLLPPDHDMWTYDELLCRVRAARGSVGRPVAVHAVTREALVLTLVVLREAGPVPGDRVEHAAVAPPELLPQIRELGVRVVTQPGFIAERGDTYAAEVEPDDLPHLYPYASLLAAGIPVSPSSDAPYSSPDPWAAVRAARDRRTPAGRVLGPGERVRASAALTGFLARPAVGPGDDADLCLLHVPWRVACEDPDAGLVRMTVCRGRVVHGGLSD